MEWDKLDYEEDDEILQRRINDALTEEDMVHVRMVLQKAGAGRGFMPQLVLDTLESKIIAEISQWVFGEKLASASLEQQEQLRSLREQSATMKNWIEVS